MKNSEQSLFLRIRLLADVIAEGIQPTGRAGAISGRRVRAVAESPLNRNVVLACLLQKKFEKNNFIQEFLRFVSKCKPLKQH